jgi:GTP-binding protein
MINHFDINRRELFWVDLPGYGYAKVSKKQRESFQKMIWNYLEGRENLRCLFALIDSRHKPQQIDIDFINELGKRQIHFAIVFTKSDKSKQADMQRNINAFNQELLKFWEELPPMFVTSAVKKRGKDKILAFMDEMIETN